MRRGVVIRRILLAIIVLVVLAAGGGYLWLRTSLPQTSGRLMLSELQAEVRIDRDEHGIPTITAKTMRDAAFGMGFVHAQDRLFQMDLMRRYGAGRLAEWFGPDALDIDRFTRTLGIYREAQGEYARLSPQTRAMLDAYAAGVNAYLARHNGALPPEYYLINAAPEPWRPADTLVWGKIMDLELAGNFRNELLHARLAQHLSPADLAILYPPYPKNAPTAVSNAARWLKGVPLDALAAALPVRLGPHFASNNWVVTGADTISGKPLLANDPHLDYSAPGVWYLLRVETPEAKLAGVTAPGTPLIVIGHNDRIAWGFTTTGGDVEDLFIERVDPTDPQRYLTPDGPQPFALRTEEIRVKGAAPVTLTVRATRHGPVISDLGGGFGTTAGDGTVLALEATWLTEDDHTADAFRGINDARDWASFRDALKDFLAPQQNVVYADVDGNIGFIAPARVPVRRAGDGWMPVPGWTGAYDWTGDIPFDQLPQAFNPPSGRVVTANNKIVPDSYPYFLGRGIFDLPYRAERIEALLKAEPKQSPASFAAIQGDDLSLAAKDLLPLLLDVQPTSAEGKAAVARLKAWDGRMGRDEVGPLLFTAWLRSLNRALFAEKLGPTFAAFWGLHPDAIRSILIEHRDWCDGAAAEGGGDCRGRLATSLEDAVAFLTKRYGGNMDEWRWGRAHEAEFVSELWSRVPLIGRLLALQIPADGGFDTVDAGGSRLSGESDPFADVHGPTLRMIADLSDLAATRFMITPGQSDNPLSPHYGDLMRSWRDISYLTLSDSRAGGSLVLAPQ